MICLLTLLWALVGLYSWVRTIVITGGEVFFCDILFGFLSVLFGPVGLLIHWMVFGGGSKSLFRIGGKRD